MCIIIIYLNYDIYLIKAAVDVTLKPNVALPSDSNLTENPKLMSVCFDKCLCK